MKKMDLMKAMNGIDEQFLLEADPYEKAVRCSFSLRRNWKLVSAFAVLLLAVGIFYPFYKSAPFGGSGSDNAAPAPAPIAAYDTELAKDMSGFDLLPETMAGGKLSDSYMPDEHTAVAVYGDENGNEAFRVIRQDIPFTQTSGEAKDDASERKEAESTASSEEIQTVYWEDNGFYYCLEIRVSGEEDSGELIGEAIRSIR